MPQQIFGIDEKEAAEKKAKKKRDREMSDLREVVKTPAGRRFYWRLLEAGGAFKDAFRGEETNRTMYALGRQSISRDFWFDLLEADREAFALMQREQGSLDKNEEIEQQKRVEDFDIFKPSV